MLYIRKLFTQDLRDGKQIAFPKEPSNLFFSFDYSNDEPDRSITFVFRACFEQFQEFDGKVITTRLYAAGSESRMDGEVKAFIRDELHAKVNDFLIIKNKGTKHIEFDFMFVPQNNELYYPLLLRLSNGDNHSVYGYDYNKQEIPPQQPFYDSPNRDHFLPYLTALRTKPFMLLAGISGTGKSRIVRELAKACWKEGDEEYGKNHPKNFCMVQVKPNWHDSSELFGYVSRISGKPEFVAGDFLKFVVKAWEETDVPYFLCLDEMNLAPVEQYFAEYLSVIESRKYDGGIITTDPVFKKPFEDKKYDDAVDYEEGMDWYQKFIVDNTLKPDLRQQFYKYGITIPNNLFVIGTVNMDETTFSFSRKVLDRAMTLEMNEVDLHGGLTDEGSEVGYIDNCIIGTAAEGKDVYANNKDLCDQVLAYLEKVNTVLEGTPFKIAYRTRNEFLLYAVNRQILDKDSQLWQTLDEMTSMKILSRIEGDSERTKSVLEGLKVLVEEEISKVIPEPEEGKEKLKSITDEKIKEMLKKLKDSGYTSYWA